MGRRLTSLARRSLVRRRLFQDPWSCCLVVSWRCGPFVSMSAFWFFNFVRILSRTSGSNALRTTVSSRDSRHPSILKAALSAFSAR